MPTATSEVQICNIALTRLGLSMISALTENTKSGRLCSLHYEPSRDAVLRAHPWNFAVKRVDLASEVDEPPFEYTYQFPLPSDFLKMVRTEDESANYVDDYRIEGGKLLSNSDTVAIEYIARISDVALFDPLFVDLLAQRLAAELAISFTDTQSMAQGFWQVYNQKLAEARGVDAQEGTPRNIEADAWVMARF
jgi:hypothetical protein